jgi:hypothetical protein
MGPPGDPHWLHEPYWEVPRHRLHLQNTDPLVFGDRFLYSNCRQGRNRKLRELAPGSLVVFGSKHPSSVHRPARWPATTGYGRWSSIHWA